MCGMNSMTFMLAVSRPKHAHATGGEAHHRLVMQFPQNVFKHFQCLNLKRNSGVVTINTSVYDNNHSVAQ